ncbi:MHS family MFS transporter [Arthrobacter sp. E918]|uniref:Putative proline/betaine transporter n=2 Tax=Arthrobacter mobilis TaxID=2724944 RepID=A0A7X6K5C9_9MICC|nr:MHS family MFS transporter [Arthrobacter mobilis]
MQATPQQGGKGIRRYVIASLVGNSLEWYDFFLYATAAAVVFGQLFFPADTDPLVGTLGAFAGFAVGFAARPLGGIFFGHIGDRVGRKSALVLTLSIMGIATFLMGVLPTYEQVGILAPVMLIVLRILQGIAAGGEWGGGVLLISENASDKRRGFFSAFSQGGVTLGFVLASAAFFLVQMLPEEQFMTWGWRLPFLFSVVLFGVGMYIRFRLPESNEFEETKKSQARPRVPVLAAIKSHPKEILVAMGLRVAENGGSYLIASFSIVYGVHVGVDRSILLLGVALSMLFSFGTILFFGHLSDRIGRRKVYAFGAAALALMAFPFFAILDTGTPALIILAYFIGNGICHAAMIGAQPAFFHELFTPEIRYSGIAVGHELAAVFAGGLAPLIATALLINYNSSTPIAIYMIILAAITLTTLALSAKVGPRALNRDDNRSEVNIG